MSKSIVIEREDREAIADPVTDLLTSRSSRADPTRSRSRIVRTA